MPTYLHVKKERLDQSAKFNLSPPHSTHQSTASAKSPCCTLLVWPHDTVSNMFDSKARGPGFDTWSGYTFISPSTDSRRAVPCYWQKYERFVLVNRLIGLSLPRNSVLRLTDPPDMTIAVYHGRKANNTQQQVLSQVSIS